MLSLDALNSLAAFPIGALDVRRWYTLKSLLDGKAFYARELHLRGMPTIQVSHYLPGTLRNCWIVRLWRLMSADSSTLDHPALVLWYRGYYNFQLWFPKLAWLTPGNLAYNL